MRTRCVRRKACADHHGAHELREFVASDPTWRRWRLARGLKRADAALRSRRLQQQNQEYDPMSIICGTDFSEMAAHAATAAACLAVRTGGPLHLVHALDLWPEELREKPGHPLLLWAESRLSSEAERLRALGADVRVHAIAGPAEVVLRNV